MNNLLRIFYTTLILQCESGGTEKLAVLRKINTTIQETDIIFDLKVHEDRGKTKNGKPYYGEAEMDLEPSCPCSVSKALCDDVCCYCQLKCRLPEGTLTKRKWLQDVYQEKCDAILSGGEISNSIMSFRSRLLENSKQIDWMCNHRSTFMNAFKTTFYPFLCIYVDNSLPLGGFYTVHSYRVDKSRIKSLVDSTPYSWVKAAIDTTEIHDEDEIDFEDFFSEKMLSANDSNTSKLIDSDVKETNKSTCEPEILLPLYLSSAQKQCLTNQYFHRELMSSMVGCTYTINRKNFTTLEELWKIILTTMDEMIYRQTCQELPEIVTYDRTNCRNTSECELNDAVNTTALNCSCLPFLVNVTFIVHHGKTVGILQDFVNGDVENLLDDHTLSVDFYSFPLEKSLMAEEKLTRFWHKFYYDECPESYCWRDIMKSEIQLPHSYIFEWNYLIYTHSMHKLIVLFIIVLAFMNVVYVFQGYKIL